MWFSIRRARAWEQEQPRALPALGAPKIAYLSCDPSTLARDLAILTGSARKTAKTSHPARSIRNRRRPSVRPLPANLSHRNAGAPETRPVRAPAVAIVAAFVCGIVLGLYPLFASISSSLAKLGLCLAGCAAFAIVALILLRFGKAPRKRSRVSSLSGSRSASRSPRLLSNRCRQITSSQLLDHNRTQPQNAAALARNPSRRTVALPVGHRLRNRPPER